MGWLFPPACVFCEHYHQDRNEHTDELPSCNAFKEIPEEIFLGDHDHSKPYPGDKGVRFRVDERFRGDFIEVNQVRRELKLLVYRIPLKVVHSVGGGKRAPRYTSDRKMQHRQRAGLQIV